MKIGGIIIAAVVGTFETLIRSTRPWQRIAPGIGGPAPQSAPTDALALAQLKTGTGSNQPLLGQGATDAFDRRILGAPLLTSPAIVAGDIWAIPRDRVTIVVRHDATLAVDRSAFFSSDRVGVRATMRVGFGYPHPAALVKMYDAP